MSLEKVYSERGKWVKLFVWFLVVIDTHKDDFTDGGNDVNDTMLQVSTSTGSLSHYYNLAIIVPRAYILGADEYYAMAGGDISLVCIIEDVSSGDYQRVITCKRCLFRLWSLPSMFTGIIMTRSLTMTQRGHGCHLI